MCRPSGFFKNSVSCDLTSDGTHTYTWDAQNRLTSGGSMSFSYDYAGQRYKSVDSSSGEYTYYLNSLMEMREGTSTFPGTPTYYIFAGSQRVAMREGSGANVIYNHQDHLGGTAITTDSAGGVNQIYDYYPYGAELENTLLGTVDAAHSFTDKELDDSLGLYYFEARWYSPTTGRFASGDPAQMDSRLPEKLVYDPQSLNFYAYSRNNPIVYTDPSGEAAILAPIIVRAVVGAIAGASALAIDTRLTGNEHSASEYVGAMVGGAATEGMITPGAGLMGLGASGVVGGVTGEIVHQGIDVVADPSANSFNPVDVIKEGLVNGATNLVPGPSIPGITSGTGSYMAVSNMVETKLVNGTINNISTETGVKMATAETVNQSFSTVVEGTVNYVKETVTKGWKSVKNFFSSNKD